MELYAKHLHTRDLDAVVRPGDCVTIPMEEGFVFEVNNVILHRCVGCRVCCVRCEPMENGFILDFIDARHLAHVKAGSGRPGTCRRGAGAWQGHWQGAGGA